MKKPLLVLNLIIKTTLEFIIVLVLISTIGAVVFFASYLAYTISNAIDTYKSI